MRSQIPIANIYFKLNHIFFGNKKKPNTNIEKGEGVILD
jgi:hypothetical protein